MPSTIYNIIHILAISKVSRLYLASVADEAGFESLVVINPADRFSRDLAHMINHKRGFEVFCKENMNGTMILVNATLFTHRSGIKIWTAPMRAANVQASLRCSLIQAVGQEKPSDRKPDPWLL